jgi:serine-type D-Ala-D-Ala endopeptidase (penicillin-binding protein 7)
MVRPLVSALALVTVVGGVAALSGPAAARSRPPAKSSSRHENSRSPAGVTKDGLPNIQAESALIVDLDSGQELYAKNADQVRAIASVGKLFLALAVRSSSGKMLPLDGVTAITDEDRKFASGGARSRLPVGKSFTNHDLLRAMLISSDNRAPTALGRAVGLDPPALVAAMNKLAKELGLSHTRFVDPSGLRGNESTAREMALALRVALEDKVLHEIMTTADATIVSKDRSARIDYHTTNQPLAASRYRITGGKTGFTTPAGYCYITGAEVAGRKVVLAFLGAPGKQVRFDDFNRVAAWLERGAPGNRLAAKRPRRAPASESSEDEPARPRERARVAAP